jgi:hypothetical protein
MAVWDFISQIYKQHKKCSINKISYPVIFDLHLLSP